MLSIPLEKNPYQKVKLCVLKGFVARIKFFDEKCKYLEVWLKHRAYNKKLAKKQILKARKYSKTEPLHSQRKEVHRNKLMLNITYNLF